MWCPNNGLLQTQKNVLYFLTSTVLTSKLHTFKSIDMQPECQY